jgi:hypothetical protein
MEHVEAVEERDEEDVVERLLTKSKPRKKSRVEADDVEQSDGESGEKVGESQ